MNKNNKFTFVWSRVSLAIKKVGQDTGYWLGPVIEADDCHNAVGWPDLHSTWSRAGGRIVICSQSSEVAGVRHGIHLVEILLLCSGTQSGRQYSMIPAGSPASQSKSLNREVGSLPNVNRALPSRP